jgi:cytochrome c
MRAGATRSLDTTFRTIVFAPGSMCPSGKAMARREPSRLLTLPSGLAMTQGRRAFIAAVLACAASGMAQQSLALDPRAQRGLVFARHHCAGFHAILKAGASPMAEAPALRTLHRRYPVEDLAEGLAEGLVTGHPSMPEWQLDPAQIGDLLAYLKTLEE